MSLSFEAAGLLEDYNLLYHKTHNYKWVSRWLDGTSVRELSTEGEWTVDDLFTISQCARQVRIDEMVHECDDLLMLTSYRQDE